MGKQKVQAAVDETAKRELELYADNESDLYPAKLNIIKRMQKSLKTNTYNADKMRQHWAAWLKLAAQKYVKNYAEKGASWQNMFNKETIAALSNEYEIHYKDEIGLGGYDSVSSIEKDIQKDLEEKLIENVEGKVITASVVDYALTGQKLYGFDIDGTAGTRRFGTGEKAMTFAKTMVKADEAEGPKVDATVEAVVAELSAALNLEPNSEPAAEFAASLDYEDGQEKGTFELDGTKYEFILSEDQAIALAEKDVVDMWESDPGTHSDFLNSYLEVTPTDCRILANEDADRAIEDLSDRDAVTQAKLQDEYDAAEEAGQDTDPVVEAAKNKIHTEKYDEVFEQLSNDPVTYFKEFGMSLEEIKKNPVVRIDYQKAAEDAVALDGWAHTLSRYNGEYETTPNGIVYFRE